MEFDDSSFDSRKIVMDLYGIPSSTKSGFEKIRKYYSEMREGWYYQHRLQLETRENPDWDSYDCETYKLVREAEKKDTEFYEALRLKLVNLYEPEEMIRVTESTTYLMESKKLFNSEGMPTERMSRILNSGLFTTRCDIRSAIWNYYMVLDGRSYCLIYSNCRYVYDGDVKKIIYEYEKKDLESFKNFETPGTPEDGNETEMPTMAYIAQRRRFIDKLVYDMEELEWDDDSEPDGPPSDDD